MNELIPDKNSTPDVIIGGYDIKIGLMKAVKVAVIAGVGLVVGAISSKYPQLVNLQLGDALNQLVALVVDKYAYGLGTITVAGALEMLLNYLKNK